MALTASIVPVMNAYLVLLIAMCICGIHSRTPAHPRLLACPQHELASPPLCCPLGCRKAFTPATFPPVSEPTHTHDTTYPPTPSFSPSPSLFFPFSPPLPPSLPPSLCLSPSVTLFRSLSCTYALPGALRLRPGCLPSYFLLSPVPCTLPSPADEKISRSMHQHGRRRGRTPRVRIRLPAAVDAPV